MSKEQLEPLSVSPGRLCRSKPLVSEGVMWELDTGWEVGGVEIEFYRVGQKEGM
jgi:hypothetical protein